jgi:DNA-directed RNA polymerase subunit RPC12/RpoP
MEFFRHCPDCGRRFHIKLESKKLVGIERTSRPKTDVTNIMAGGIATSASQPVFVVQEGRPIVIDVEEFQYSYKCGHCGHEWSEKHVEKRREG